MTHGDQYTDALLADELGISKTELYKTLNEVSNLAVLSLEDTLNESGTMDVKSENLEMDPQGSLDTKETELQLKMQIENLPEKKRWSFHCTIMRNLHIRKSPVLWESQNLEFRNCTRKLL